MSWWKKAKTTAALPVAHDPPPTVAVQPRGVPSPQTGQPPSLASIVNALRLEDPREPLDEQVEVAGENYHIKDIKRVYKDQGMPITSRGTTLENVQCILVPERWNEHDPNAVAVLIGVHHVGYIPGDLAKEYSPPLLRLAGSSEVLATGFARIWAKDDGGMVRARVTLRLPEATAFM